MLGGSDPGIKDESQPAADRQAERGQTSEVVADAIAKLPVVYREALVLRDIEGLAYEEIAEILGIPGGTVRSRINRARIMLKDKLKGFAKTEL
jgi:RNA polymerase sigma-70 factor (ECF subfamily)